MASCCCSRKRSRHSRKSTSNRLARSRRTEGGHPHPGPRPVHHRRQHRGRGRHPGQPRHRAATAVGGSDIRHRPSPASPGTRCRCNSRRWWCMHRRPGRRRCRTSVHPSSDSEGRAGGCNSRPRRNSFPRQGHRRPRNCSGECRWRPAGSTLCRKCNRSNRSEGWSAGCYRQCKPESFCNGKRCLRGCRRSCRWLGRPGSCWLWVRRRFRCATGKQDRVRI